MRRLGSHTRSVALLAVVVGVTIGATLLISRGSAENPGADVRGPVRRTSHDAQRLGPSTNTLPAGVSGKGMHVVFDARFSGTSLNRTQWDTCYSFPSLGTTAPGCTNFGNRQEIEWYLPSQDAVSGGTLSLRAEFAPTKGTTESGAPKIYHYRSGMVTTSSSFKFAYGYVQMVARLPPGPDLWPAFWMLPASGGPLPEIDIIEGAWTAHRLTANLHPTAGPTFSRKLGASPSPQAWQTYGLRWQPDVVTWYVDGKPVAVDVTSVPHVAMYLLIDLAVTHFVPSCLRPPVPRSCDGSLQIGSVKVWQH